MSEISINTVENIDEIDQIILLTTYTTKLHIYYRVTLHFFDFHQKKFPEIPPLFYYPPSFITPPPFITFERVYVSLVGNLDLFGTRKSIGTSRKKNHQVSTLHLQSIT